MPASQWDLLQFAGWSADGAHIYVTAMGPSGPTILSYDQGGNFRPLQEERGQLGWYNSPVASPDGRYFVYTNWTWDRNVVMLDNF
jgi:Tol biopolymer transport system component